MAKRTRQELYRVEEQSRIRGSKTWRTMRGSKGSKEEAERYMILFTRGVAKAYGDRFRYRVVKYKK